MAPWRHHYPYPHYIRPYWSFVLDGVVAFVRPYDSYHAVENWAYWARDIDLELHLGSSGRFVFLGWHNVEVFELPLQQRGELYVSRPTCWPSYQSGRLLSVPMPPVFAY